MSETTIEYWFKKGFNAGVKVQIEEHKTKKKVDGRAIWGEIEKQIERIKNQENTELLEIIKLYYTGYN